MKNKSIFSDRLMKLRTDRGMSRTELGEKLGFTGTSANKNIFNYENSIREPEYSTLVLLARALDCSTDYLLGIVDEPNRFTGDVDGHHQELLIDPSEEDKPYSKEQFENLIHKLESIGIDVDKLMEK